MNQLPFKPVKVYKPTISDEDCDVLISCAEFKCGGDEALMYPVDKVEAYIRSLTHWNNTLPDGKPGPDYKADEKRQCSMSKKIESLKKTPEANGPTDCCPNCGTKAGAPEVSFEGNRIYTEYFCEKCWTKWHLESVFKKMVVTSVPNERKTRR